MRTILAVRDLLVFERDAPHGREKPLRLGLGPEEEWAVLEQARMAAGRWLEGGKQDTPAVGAPGDRARLAARASVAVAVWVRGRLRGSVIVPGDMGRELAGAFERAFSLLTRAHGALEVNAPSKILTPRWHRVFHHLARLGLARRLVLSQPLENGLPLYYFDISSPFLGHQTDAGEPAAPRKLRLRRAPHHVQWGLREPADGKRELRPHPSTQRPTTSTPCSKDAQSYE